MFKWHQAPLHTIQNMFQLSHLIFISFNYTSSVTFIFLLGYIWDIGRYLIAFLQFNIVVLMVLGHGPHHRVTNNTHNQFSQCRDDIKSFLKRLGYTMLHVMNRDQNRFQLRGSLSSVIETGGSWVHLASGAPNQYQK